jgi:peptidoglycan hydrolase-like protein with peptidoglycan-binding domain
VGAKFGDRGPGIGELQYQLGAAGVDPPPQQTAKFTEATRLALMSFQESHALPPTGIVDAATLSALEVATPIGPPDRGQPSGTGQGELMHPKLDGYPVYDQNDNKGRLGLGTAYLSEKGCIVTSLAMAVSKTGGETISPEEMNQRLIAGGAFAPGQGALQWNKGAEVAGVDIRKVPMDEPGAVETLKTALRAGNPVMMRVDYNGDGMGDHTVLLTGINPDGSFRGVDPAGKIAVNMKADTNENINGVGWRKYTAIDFRIVTAAKPAEAFEPLGALE